MIDFFSSIGGLSTLVLIITEWINKQFKVQKAWVKQLISWCVSILLCIGGFILSMGLFATFGGIGTVTGWIYTVLSGIGVGLISNGLYDISAVQTILNNLFDWVGNVSQYFTKNKKEGDD